MRSTFVSVLAFGLVACGAHVTSTPVVAPAAGTPIRYAIMPDSTHLASGRLVSLDAERLAFERWVADAGREGAWIPDSVPTSSVARLQARVGRRGNAGRGALIGAAVGLGLGVACASEDSWVVSAEECMAGYAVLGIGTGALIGLLAKSDVWAPVAVPPQGPGAGAPPVTLRVRPWSESPPAVVHHDPLRRILPVR